MKKFKEDIDDEQEQYIQSEEEQNESKEDESEKKREKRKSLVNNFSITGGVANGAGGKSKSKIAMFQEK